MTAGSLVSGDEVNFSGSDEVSKWYRYDVAGNSNQKVVTHTFMYGGQVLRNYTMLYDKTKKAALWVAFAMNSGTYPHKVSRGDNWNYDPALVFGSDYSWQPKLSSSYGGGYERGHQVASNDRRTTIYQMYQTDYFSNMTPQLSDFNSGDKTVWDELEGDIQDLGYSITGDTWLFVVTGAIFGEGYKTDATDNNNRACPVPTHYYKCIMKVTYRNGSVDTAAGAAYLFEHKANAEMETKTIRALEDLTGFDFFTNIPPDKQETAETNITSLF